MTSYDQSVSQEIIINAFNNLLGRPPEQSAIDYYSRYIAADGASAITVLLRGIIDSDEFLQRFLHTKNLIVNDIAADTKMRADPRYESLDFKNLLSTGEYTKIVEDIRSVCPNQEQTEYINYHYDRFRELYGLVRYFAGHHKRLCEISTSPASRCMKAIFGGYYMSVDQPGNAIDNQPNSRTRSDSHLQIDLNTQSLNEKMQALKVEGFDLILFTEIIEHLLKSPYDIVADLAGCLRTGGRLFISTPNVFSHGALKLMALKQHPTAILPRGNNFASGARHVREYTMAELIDIVTANGLEVEYFGFSDCWDSGNALKSYLDNCPDQRTCLYVLARKTSV